MASSTTQLADNLVTLLNGGTFCLPFTAQRVTMPRFDIKDLDELKVCVVPRGRKTEIYTRGDNWTVQTIEVGVMQRVQDINDPALVDPVGQLVEEIESFLLRLEVDEWQCTEVANILADDSLFAKEHLYDN